MQEVSKPHGAQWNAGGSWGTGSNADDGGWSQGPPASGSGWTGTVAGTAAANGTVHDTANWGNAQDLGSVSDWQQPPKPNIIVDRNDKEAWPSIGGDNSESTSENGDDNASVKSGSVISVSSNQGQTHDKTSGPSAIHSQSASSLWSTPNFNGMDSSTWSGGIGIPNSSAANISSVSCNSSMSWTNPLSTSLSSNNQGYNVQSTSSSDFSNQMNLKSVPSSTVASRTTVSGWGVSGAAPGALTQAVSQNQGGNRPQSTVQIQQSSTPRTIVGGGNGGNGNFMQGQMGSGALQPNGPQTSASATVSQPGQKNSSVMSVQQQPQQQGSSNNSAFQSIHGMSASSVFSSKSQAELAWGSIGSGPQSQGSANNAGGDAANAGKGSGNNGQLKSSESAAGGWGAPPPVEGDAKLPDGWSGNPSSSGDWGNSVPSSGSQWDSTPTTKLQGPPHQWPGATPGAGQNQDPPRSQPTSWAEAAGKGLTTNPSNASSNPSASNENTVQTPPQQESNPIDMEFQRAIDSHDGWGQRPVRQDTAWDMSQAPKTQRKPPPATTEKNPNSNMWNNNSGTAIWEASKDNAPAWNGPPGGGPPTGGPPGSGPPGSGPPGGAPPGAIPRPNPQTAQWDGSRNDPKSWTGPPKPRDPNNWGGTSKPEKPVAGQWGGPGGNEASQQGSGQWGNKVEVGSWGNTGEPPGTISTWGETTKGRREVDDGTSLWNSSAGHMQKPPSNWNAPPNQQNTPNTPNSQNNPNMMPMPSMPSGMQTGMPTGMPGGMPTGMPGGMPTGMPGGMPTGMPGGMPGGMPTGMPGGMPTGMQGRPDEWNRGNKPPPPQPGQGSGWGEPPPPNMKGDDSSRWVGNQQQQQARAGGWGETSQWNPKQSTSSSSSSWGEEWNPNERKVRIGNPKPSSTSLSSWVGPDGADMYWNNPPDPSGSSSKSFNWGEKDMIWNHSDNRKDDMMWNEDGSSNYDDADMGTWNDTTQENNSSWSSASGWKFGRRNLVKGGATSRFPGSGNQPQMRSRLLQQLMEMGFQKDEAQHALINNNMSLNHALADLYKQKGASVVKRDDMDVFHPDGAKPKLPGMDIGATDHNDISDTQSESNPFVPNINSMQNTPFPNAQSQLPNQFIANSMKGPSLTQSSQNMNPSIIMPQQQRHIQEKFKVQQQTMSAPPPMPPPTQGMVARGSIPPPNQAAVQQQMAQQQILQQLHLAVKAGLISPQLLNQQLPPPLLIMLQQLLQHQQSLQSHITMQQLLQQNKMGQNLNPMVQRQQLDSINTKINAIKQQILHLQRQISDAQKVLMKPSQQQTPTAMPPNTPAGTLSQQEADPINTLPTDLNNLAISTSQPQPQSKLSQWRRSTSEKDGAPGSSSESVPTTTTTQPNENGALNKAVGSKPNIHQSQSTPNLRYGDLGLANLGGDPTWSNMPTVSSSSENWPSAIGTSSSSITTSSQMPTGKDSATLDVGKDFPKATTSASSTLNLNDSIPEFVPGKPWQGISKSVEDDPHITPGSYSRSYSLSTPKEDDLSSLTKTSPSTSESPSWSKNPQQIGRSWSGVDNVIPTSFSNEVWGVPLPKNASRPPPGLMQQNKPGGNWTGVNRQHSWAGSGSTGNWIGAPSNCLLLRNLTPQIDGSTLRTLCLQHGPLICFYLSLNQGQALVRYNSKEEAIKAQKSLNTCVLSNTTIVAEFVSEAEAVRFAENAMSTSQPSQWSQQQQQSQQYRSTVGGGGMGRSVSTSGVGDLGSWNTTPSVVPMAPGIQNSNSMWGAGSGQGSGGLWGMEDHSASLLGNMLGESM
ncbi:trinucleotide repeat-containing gene 6C protein-like isoform X3 [Pecten maximus]|uniref:trinucleotide repeat-containing gene 6C protein-like isoform X3 n=1 Tax=Pecten maximus TaxID=6579 RepID=UPI0014589A78|nr:trinucleotide repeat-containing gene 6C protein-like isoform X3 [Pecten maximus]